MVGKIKVTIKPVGDGCNLACEHCYVAGEPKKVKRMTEDTLARLLEKSADYANKVEVIWHGGEPLLAGIPFFKKAMKLQTELPADFHNFIQSNFTLLNDEWVDFIVENGIEAGTSLDGVPDIHNAVRHYADGRGSYEQVIAGIERLRSKGKNTGAIATFTRYMVGRHMEVYDAFKELNLWWQLNPMLKSARNDLANKRLFITPQEYADAMIELIDKYLFDDEAPVFDTADKYIRRLIFGAKSEKIGYCPKGSCQDTNIVVDANGDVYPCVRFSEMPEANLGNVNNDSMEDIFRHPFKERMKLRSIETVEGCKECEYRKACNTGCSQIAYWYNGDQLAKDPLCPAYKKIYGHIVETVTKLKKGVIKCQQQ